MKNKTVNVHVDASFSHEHNVATYAFWISFGQRNYSMRNVGSLPSVVDNSVLAELYAIRNTLQVLARHPQIHEVEIVKIYTDCYPAISAINGQATKNVKVNEVAGAIQKIILQLKTKTSARVALHKAESHVTPTNKSQYVHDWCDKSARERLQLLIKQKTKKQL
jgi:ribonuclease HI